jgi:acyl carrier protein
MNKKEFLNEIEELLELDENSLTGTELLEELGDWDSLAIMGFIAIVDDNFEVTLEADKIVACVTVDHLILLVSDYLKE